MIYDDKKRVRQFFIDIQEFLELVVDCITYPADEEAERLGEESCEISKIIDKEIKKEGL